MKKINELNNFKVMIVLATSLLLESVINLVTRPLSELNSSISFSSMESILAKNINANVLINKIVDFIY